MGVFTVLDGAQYMSLTTYRKDGRAVATPVWFTEDNGKVYVMTFGSTGKVKRIRNNPTVQVAPSDARGTILGDTMNAKAIIHEAQSEMAKKADALLDKKYGFTKKFLNLIQWQMRNKKVFLEISLT